MSGQVNEAIAQYRIDRHSHEGGNSIEAGVPPGYKQTEVGVVPEVWGVSDIQTISSVPMQNGLFYEPARKGKGKGIINVGDLYKATPIDLDLLELFDATDTEIKTFKVEDGDLFFTRSSIVPSGIAHCNIYYSGSDQRKIVFDSHLIRVRVNTEDNDPRYIYLACLSRLARKHLIGSAKTATMTTIDQGAIKECPVLIPFKNEQTATANALSDVDTLITSLEKLITKKRAIKTATMQQLLTGKKRLPPFNKTHTGYKQTELGEIPEDWWVKAIGEALSIRHGRDQKQVERQGGAYPILGTGGEMGATDTFLYNKPSVLIGRKGTINKPVYMESPFWTVDTLFYSEVNEKFSAKFIYYKFCLVDWLSYNEASGVPSLNASTIESVIQSFPKNRDEQTAIAGVLSDIDKDIEGLEQRLNKTQQLKQGMMQELLTGRTRLV